MVTDCGAERAAAPAESLETIGHSGQDHEQRVDYDKSVKSLIYMTEL